MSIRAPRSSRTALVALALVLCVVGTGWPVPAVSASSPDAADLGRLAPPPPGPEAKSNSVRTHVNSGNFTAAKTYATAEVVSRMARYRADGYRYGKVTGCRLLSGGRYACPSALNRGGARRGTATLVVAGSAAAAKVTSVTFRLG